MYYRYMIYFFFLMMRLPPIVTRTVTLLPYTTLFLSASATASAGRLCASSAGSPSARCCGTALAVWAVVVVPVDALFGVAPSARTPGCGALVPGGAIVVAVCGRTSPRREASWPGFRCALAFAFAFACAGGRSEETKSDLPS